MYPARTVAGDYYGFIELPAGEIAVVMADVSGKGVAAGLLMPSIEVVLRMDAARFPGTSDLLARATLRLTPDSVQIQLADLQYQSRRTFIPIKSTSSLEPISRL
jgi:sigma-B regulation protein RsbU (phosphoserine phosphatase)